MALQKPIVNKAQNQPRQVNVAATRRGKVEMSLSAIMGSAIIAYTLIPACCVLAADAGDMLLQTKSVIRDVWFYLASLGLLMFSFLVISKCTK